MPRTIYRIDGELRYDGSREWIAESVNVLSNGDASRAVAKARRHFLKQSWEDIPETGKNQGKVIIRRANSFRFTAVKELASAEI